MSTVQKTRRPRKPLTPAAGSCRWAVQPGIGRCAHPGVLVITSNRSNGEPVTEAYTVTENLDGVCLVGYQLTKPDGTVYDVAGDLNSCDCPDYTMNRAHATTPDLRLCKHCRGLKAALAKLAG